MNAHWLLFKNPWWIVVGAMFALIVGNGPVGLFTFGVFLKPVSSEFGWERGHDVDGHRRFAFLWCDCDPHNRLSH